MNRGEEDYIKALYALESKGHPERPIPNQKLREYFGHTAQTVIEMIRRLERKGLVEYRPYKGSRLTGRGRDAAVRMIRIHRIWEVFLIEKLGYSREEVHEEAETLEHATSDRLQRAMYEYLGDPEHCPHGHPIPPIPNDRSKNQMNGEE